MTITWSISKEAIDVLLDDMCIEEMWDEENQNASPEDASEKTLYEIVRRLLGYNLKVDSIVTDWSDTYILEEYIRDWYYDTVVCFEHYIK